MHDSAVELDIAILGGGITGLWTLATLRAAGYATILFETGELGGVQTIASQGIIHGGIKYALTGKASLASSAIGEMPELWRACLHGGTVTQPGPAGVPLPDLRCARVLSESQYLWTTSGIGSRLMGVAASKAIRTSVTHVPTEARPPALRASATPGARTSKFEVYRVDEPVLDVRSVVESMVIASGGSAGPSEGPASCVSYRSMQSISLAGASRGGCSMELVGAATHDSGMSPPVPVRVRARRVVFAAGAGNERLLTQAGFGQGPSQGIKMQRRPLHMVMLHAAGLPDLFGHCIGLSDKPRLTVTSSRDDTGRVVWYIGGQLAEQGVARDVPSQIAAAKRELHDCLPWIDWGSFVDARWATWRVDRAEGLMSGGSRPDMPVVESLGSIIVAWPTKLAFAPLVARKVLSLVRESGIEPTTKLDMPGRERFLTPPIAAYPWNREEVEWIR